MDERTKLEQAIVFLEEHRWTLGDETADTAIAGLRDKLEELDRTRLSGDTTAELKDREGERKVVTVMFADISGFTAMSERLDPEPLRDLMNNCFSRLVPIIRKYDGHIDKFIGDAVMAVFGVPATHENDAERACRAALEMMHALNDFSRENNVDLALHIGINTGPVVAGGIGTPERREYSVMGDAVNTACRLEDLSERGRIFVGPDTYRLTSHVFKYGVLSPVRLKGKSDPIRIYRLDGLKRASPAKTLLPAEDGTAWDFVGREHELGILENSLNRLFAGRGGVVLVTGEAGIGKSRLVAETKRRLETGPSGRAVTWLEGKASSFGRITAYRPFQEILLQYAGLSEDDTQQKVHQRLAERTQVLLGPQAQEILPYLAALLNLDVTGEYSDRIKYLDGEAMRAQIFLAGYRFCRRLAEKTPTVLVFEDLHWFDRSSTGLLVHILDLVYNHPLLVLIVTRPNPPEHAAEVVETLEKKYADHRKIVALNTLTADECSRVVAAILKSDGIAPSLRDTIVRKAEGNPFFLEQIVRTLIDRNLLTRDGSADSWRPVSSLEAITIPDTVHGLIMARVDGLDDGVKRVLRTASIIGRSFAYRLIRELEQRDPRLDEHLQELQQIALIREKHGIPEPEYTFKHALVQEATYESILIQKRKELHGRVGRAMETLFADRIEDFYSIIAYHFAQAEQWDKAKDYLIHAGDQAGRIAADAEALSHYRRALKMYDGGFGEAGRPPARVQLERKIGEALFRRGRHAEALEHLHQALALIGSALPSSKWGIRFEIALQGLRQLVHLMLPSKTVTGDGSAITPDVEEMFKLYEIIAWIDIFGNDERFLLLTLRALNSSEAVGYDFGIVGSTTTVGLIADFTALLGLARHYHTRSVELAEKIEHRGGIGLARLGMTFHLMTVGRWSEAVAMGERTQAIHLGIGNLHAWGVAAYMTALSKAYSGFPHEALDDSLHIVRSAKETSDNQVRCWGLSVQGYFLSLLGRLDEAIAVLLEARDIASTTYDHVFRVWTGAEAGRCYCRKGDFRAGRDAIEAARHYNNEHPTRSIVWLPFYNALAEGYLLLAEHEEYSPVRRPYDKARKSCRKALKHGKRVVGMFPEALRWYGTFQYLIGKRRSAKRLWHRSLEAANSMDQPYDAARTLNEIGRRLNHNESLAKADEIFTAMGIGPTTPYANIGQRPSR